MKKPRNHGFRKNIIAEYRSWVMMRNRCNNPNAIDYKYYGAKGIKVVKRWDYFPTFLKDMGFKPSANHTLDRINVNRNYTPKNCKWSTRTEQSRNRNYCKLNLKKARLIRKLMTDKNVNILTIAKKFKVSKCTLYLIRRGCSWKEKED